MLKLWFNAVSIDIELKMAKFNRFGLIFFFIDYLKTPVSFKKGTDTIAKFFEKSISIALIVSRSIWNILTENLLFTCS